MRANEIPYARALPIRMAVLRPEAATLAEVEYAEDSLSTTRTFAVEIGSDVISIGTVMESGHPKSEAAGSWRIRGMATVTEYRGHGYGRVVIDEMIDYVRRSGGVVVWCNARVQAVDFYRRAGFVKRGDVFETAGGRPHIIMDFSLDQVS